MEVVLGNGMGLLSVDIKEPSENLGTLNMFRFNNQRTGFFESSQSVLLGDLNQDSIIDILDIVQLINIVIGNQEPNPTQIWSADLNSDNTVDVLDIVQLVNIILN